ncbi:MAG: hypothetical protein QM204_00365 [Bacillota bacterium]|jgi:hypothetical protein|nr:hypothetical protein [Bacillota bacterium]NLL26161.1 hypothetical protein [Erysipelotrichia bacterium]
MLTITTLMSICQNCQMTKKQRLLQILDFLKKEGFYYIDGKLFLSENNNLYQKLNYTTSVIKITSDNKKVDKTCKFVLDLIEHENAIKKIISSINSIILEEDRRIFIDRYLFDLTIQEIMRKNYISQKTYYNSIRSSTIHLYRTFLIN